MLDTVMAPREAELLKAAQEFRSRGVPLDAIVQDGRMNNGFQ
jgi:hypothetical protein